MASPGRAAPPEWGMGTRLLKRTIAAACAAMAMAVAAQGPDEQDSPIEAAGPQGPLRGTLRLPPGRGGVRPAVLIVPGSGPTNRDGNSPLGLRAAPYRMLAEGLAARGIASVRIDKRGLFGSAGAVADANAVTLDDYAHDLRRWVQAVRARTGVPCVWVLGHSEGGLVALAAARQSLPVCGWILVATPGRPPARVLREQLRANPANAPLLPPAMAAIDALEAGHPVDTANLPAALRPLFDPAVQGFLISLFAIDPARLIAGLQQPVLIVQGTRDLQVQATDAQRLKQAAPAARLVLLEGVNHVLKPVASDDRAANLATYGDPGLPLAPGVVEAVADFVAP